MQHAAPRRTAWALAGQPVTLDKTGTARLRAAILATTERVKLRLLAPAARTAWVEALVQTARQLLAREDRAGDQLRDLLPGSTGSLRAAMAKWNCPEGLLLTESEEGELKVPAGTITCRPLWSWLLEPVTSR